MHGVYYHESLDIAVKLNVEKNNSLTAMSFPHHTNWVLKIRKELI